MHSLSTIITLQNAMPAETPCTAVTNGVASCILRTRLSPGSMSVSATYLYMYMLKFSLDKNFAKPCYFCIMKVISTGLKKFHQLGAGGEIGKIFLLQKISRYIV